MTSYINTCLPPVKLNNQEANTWHTGHLCPTPAWSGASLSTSPAPHWSHGPLEASAEWEGRQLVATALGGLAGLQ